MTSGSDGLALGDFQSFDGAGVSLLKACKQADIFSPFVRVFHKTPHHISDRLVEFIGFVPISTKPPFFYKEKRLEINVKIDDYNYNTGTEITMLGCP